MGESVAVLARNGSAHFPRQAELRGDIRSSETHLDPPAGKAFGAPRRISGPEGTPQTDSLRHNACCEVILACLLTGRSLGPAHSDQVRPTLLPHRPPRRPPSPSARPPTAERPGGRA